MALLTIEKEIIKQTRDAVERSVSKQIPEGDIEVQKIVRRNEQPLSDVCLLQASGSSCHTVGLHCLKGITESDMTGF